MDLGRDTGPVWYELGRNLTYQQRWDDAATAFRTALKRSPDDRDTAVELAAFAADRARFLAARDPPVQGGTGMMGSP